MMNGSMRLALCRIYLLPSEGLVLCPTISELYF